MLGCATLKTQSYIQKFSEAALCGAFLSQCVLACAQRQSPRDGGNAQKAIHAHESHEEALAKATDVVNSLKGMKLRKAAELVESHIAETLA